MKIFLVRHGDADAEVPEGLGDEARALTRSARHQLPTHFTQLAAAMNGTNAVYMSPLVRAVQTAQILTLAQHFEGALHTHKSLLPDMPVGAIEAILAAHPRETVALVGHQPSMGAMAAHLLGLPSFPKPVSPGTVIGIELPDEGSPPAPGRLLFYAAPGHPVVDALT